MASAASEAEHSTTKAGRRAPLGGRRSTTLPGGTPLKPSTEDKAEGRFHEVKGKLEEQAGKLGLNPELEAQGRHERVAGKVQRVIGKIKGLLGK
jgi:uncharacterized protein YjbJ (UPF0337 family)